VACSGIARMRFETHLTARSQPPRIRANGRTCSITGPRLLVFPSPARSCRLRVFHFRTAPLSAQKMPTPPESLAALKREVKLEQIRRGEQDAAASNKETSEEYWLDMEGLEHQDTVTDFNLPEGTFFDTATVHLLTTATLERLHDLYPEGRFAVPRFRPNVVVKPAEGSDGFVEDSWLGRIVAIGDSVRLKINLNCARCVMTTLAQGNLPKDPGILRTAAQHNQVNVGVYASVLQGGTIQRGDSVRLV
jgi:uncharacterized protein